MSDGLRQSCTWRTRRTHGELLPSPWDRPGASWLAMILDRGTVEDWLPALDPCRLPGAEPPHILAVAPGAGRSHGDGGRPGSAQPDARENLNLQVRLNLPGKNAP
jgi:hypothetical protein